MAGRLCGQAEVCAGVALTDHRGPGRPAAGTATAPGCGAPYARCPRPSSAAAAPARRSSADRAGRAAGAAACRPRGSARQRRTVARPAPRPAPTDAAIAGVECCSRAARRGTRAPSGGSPGLGRAGEIGPELALGGRQGRRPDLQDPAELQHLGVEPAALRVRQRRPEQARHRHQPFEEDQMHPGVGLRVQRPVAAAAVVDAADRAVHLLQALTLGERGVAAVDERQRRLQGVQQPAPRIGAEHRVLADACADHRVRDLHDHRTGHHHHQPPVTDQLPQQRAGTAGLRLFAHRVERVGHRSSS